MENDKTTSASHEEWYRIMMESMVRYEEKVEQSIEQKYSAGLKLLEKVKGKQREIIQFAWKYERSICQYNLVNTLAVLRKVCASVREGNCPPGVRKSIMEYLDSMRRPKLPSLTLCKVMMK